MDHKDSYSFFVKKKVVTHLSPTTLYWEMLKFNMKFIWKKLKFI